MIICPNCSNANPDASRFCNECGTRLSAPPPAAAARMPQQPAAPPAPVPMPPSPAPPPELISAAPADPHPDPSSQRVDAPEPEGEVPDWLRDLRQTGLTVMPEGQAAPPEPPSWLAALPASPEPAWELPQPGPESPAHGMPSGSGAAAAMPHPDEERETGTPTPASGTPQAARAVAESPRPAEAPTTDSPAPASVSPMLAHPSNSSPLASRLAARAGTRTPFQAVPAEAEEMPDWLRELRGAPETPPAPAPVEAQLPQVEQPPAWLSDLRIETVEIKAPLEPAPSPAIPLPADAVTPAAGGLPDWLKGLSEPQPAPAAAGPQPAPAPVTAPIIDEGTPAAEVLAPAEIPDWVLELRPGATAAAPVQAEILERSGLLAGIRGALPVEPAVSMPHIWSPVPPLKASLPLAGFTELHAPKPDRPDVPPAPPAGRRSGCLGRAGLPLLILFVISLAFLPFPNASDWRGAAIAAYQPSRDFYQMINHINGLQPDGLALVAIDYGAQSRAELDPQARAVLSHLFQNKQRMILLSLVPEGGQLAQDLLASRNPANSQFNYPYNYGQTHLNLGFQPGGEAALRQLAQGLTLRQIPDVRDQVPAANWPITQNWKSLDDVALIVIFSDDGAQVVRWIEQVGVRPDQSTRTLLAGVNKASESYVMPYYESKQLKGLLAGTHGAAEYEGFLLQPASAAATLDGISYVVIVLVAVIMLSLAATALKRRVS